MICLCNIVDVWTPGLGQALLVRRQQCDRCLVLERAGELLQDLVAVYAMYIGTVMHVSLQHVHYTSLR